MNGRRERRVVEIIDDLYIHAVCCIYTQHVRSKGIMVYTVFSYIAVKA